MILRYTRPEMGIVWEEESKFSKMLEVEITIAKVQAKLGIIPKKPSHKYKKKQNFQLKKFLKLKREQNMMSLHL